MLFLPITCVSPISHGSAKELTIFSGWDEKNVFALIAFYFLTLTPLFNLLVSRDNGVLAIESLMKKKGKFDYILLETTGLADPAPIAEMFWMDDAIGSDIYLDGIVTLIDTRNVRKVIIDWLQYFS